MTKMVALNSSDGAALPRTAARIALAGVPDDKAMLRAAAELTRDLHMPNPRIYWTDTLLSAAVGYGAMLAAMLLLAHMPLLAVVAGAVSVLALYRASLFIHEISHLKLSLLPGYRTAWNLIVGIPLMVPSFTYEGVHPLHHARTRYGTIEDPEYLPLARMKWYSLPLFMGVAVIAPVAFLFRYAVLGPVSFLYPPLRRAVVAKYSALKINPAFERRQPEGEFKRQWLWQEAGASLFTIGLLVAVATGVVPLQAFLVYLVIIACVTVINQVRTLVAHLWENEGEPLTVTAQFLDSVNVPPPSLLPYLWAPVGLRFHALHHLLPGLPYHALGEAHRRLTAALEGNSAYHKANYPTLSGLVAQLARGTLRAR